MVHARPSEHYSEARAKKRRKQQEQREQKNKSECEIQSLKGDEDDKIEEVNECVYLVNQMTRCGVDME